MSCRYEGAFDREGPAKLPNNLVVRELLALDLCLVGLLELVTPTAREFRIEARHFIPPELDLAVGR